jgi:glutamate formiminotransferase
MKPVIECVPNFSEARNAAVMNQIATEIEKVSGVKLVNRHSDKDHNRTVLTLIGSPEAIGEAAFLGAKLASERINLELHRGQHPRIGALDVLPFIPLQETPMDICVEVAHLVGQRIGNELQIPVYYYGEAALLPARRALEDIRRGEYEQLKSTINSDPTKKPDAGPTVIGRAGAIAVGARKPLIAFNVFLETNDVAVAKKIAKKVRFSSGGFPAVKALGLSVNGKAQVSMNLTDYSITNLPIIFEKIKQEAKILGTKIFRSEVVGLLPQEAVLSALADYLQLPELTSEMLIESYIK